MLFSDAALMPLFAILRYAIYAIALLSLPLSLRQDYAIFAAISFHYFIYFTMLA